MATGELLRPGVEVIQQIRTASPSFVRPTLVPCVVGPAFEVLNVLNSDGTLNSKAKYGGYAQLGKLIAENSFPDPRSNIDELDIIETSIKAYMLAGGVLKNLPLTNGSSFLATSHEAGKAGIKTRLFGGAVGLALNAKVLNICIDNPVAADRTKDIAITFVGSGVGHVGNITAKEAAAQINAACDAEVATVVFDNPDDLATDRVLLSGKMFGALSSITVRAGGSANTILEVGFLSTDLVNPGGHEERIEGYGYRGQDDNNNDTVTPWIEFYRGEYYLDGKGTLDPITPPAYPTNAGCTDLSSGAFVSGVHAAITFTGGSATVPLLVGDYIMADGVRLKDGEITRVEESRFKVGTINSALSTADADGNYTSKVYDTQQVGTLFDANAFAPQYVYFQANDLDWRKAVATAAVLTGTGVSPTAATAGVLTGASVVPPFAIAGLKLHYVSKVDGVETEGFFTFTGGPFVSMTEVAAALNGTVPGVVVTDNAGQLVFTTSKTGRLQSFTLKGDGTVNATIGLPVVDTTVTGTDVEYAGLATKVLEFTFDKNPHIYKVTAISDSLDELVDEINRTVGANVASKDSALATFLSLTSPLKGSASEVKVLDTGATGAEDLLGLDTVAVAGSGRPYPDAYLDDSLILHIGAELLRDQVTGYPLDQAYDTGTLYIQYKALRKDVSAIAKVPGVLKLSDTTTLTSVLSPLTEENPLGLGLFLTMINAPTFEVKGLGIDEVTGAAPEGTLPAWARAASLLEAEEVYAIAPLTQDETVHGMWRTHCSVMSSPEQGGERIVFNNKKMPVRKNPVIVASGTSANSTANSNQLIIDSNPTPGLVDAGIPTVGTIPVSAGVYVELEVAGEKRRYNVQKVSGSLLDLRTTFAAGENDDAFYSDVKLDVPVVNSAYSAKVLGASIAVPGSNPVRYDYQTMAETVAEANGLLKNRRDFEVFPETVKAVIGGIEKSLPGYYAAAAIVGMVGAQPPQQGFTNFPMTGITGVVGTEKFTKRQLNIMAGGGTYILMQEVVGGSVFCRHQLSTDTTSVETRELSITKVVDFVAKFLRQGVRRFIGTNNINSQLLDTLGATVHAILKFLEESGVLNGYNINNLVQDKSNPDTVLIDVTLDVPYPCNYIRLTLMV